MSDPTMIEEDSLISQNDIDKLLESNSIEDAEDDEMELISQDDIDQLMNSNVISQEDTALQKDLETDSEEEDFGELSQDDIDSLMNSNPASEEKILSALDDEEEFEELSKEDVRAMMGSQESTPDMEKGLDSEILADSSLNLEDDILMDERIEEVPAPVKEKSKKQDDFVINESEAVGVSDCLVSQKTIDGLIKKFNTAPDSGPVILDEEPDSAMESEEISELSAIQMPLDDTEDFLKPKSDVDVLELNDEREDVTQEDIDALLTESDDDEVEEAEDDILISQDDIDTLLMAADQDDEDILGDLMDKESDTSLDAGEDGDLLEKGELDEEIKDEEEDEDLVVLQGDDEALVKPKKKKQVGSSWYKKKMVLVAASILVILGITVPTSYFLFFSGGHKAPEIVSAPEEPVVSPQKKIEVETHEAPVQKQVENKNPGNMVLKDFVILPPDVSKDMAYVTTDISIDYADQKAQQEILNNLSYFRDLIYDSIRKSLVVEKRDKMSEAEILSMVETTLKKVLPANSISRVSFISFKIG